ncbi:pheromone-regulated protein PRM1 KNAG_0F00390 [Huiozyma naganishii CBS 8797]|uniref:Plasma membrane fusion protein PRM1 n=1 Tax=Huiozyma naganishii (strain ATCC MYA-139 / BCRC 22969 / CBS 8797 / KCTC 17520 / NBRC 10181 / NCYC 3082 / Yp74L-3) TaxID=1071383 RepID=J7S712_HUIN7|nr:hypothetical protein KNAG_0F00390 [Kazachstania naganishii CBS 8797]CCK70709.1 hypothetical protein KNAG_0F00390 [Kazachstania naganishii CBS 8797]
MRKYTTYLQLKDRLSQIWINKYTLVLTLSLFKLVFFSNSVNDALRNTNSSIIGNCQTIDTLYNNISTNTPHYLGLMGNYMVEKSLEETVKATVGLLSMLVLASEELITFVIDLYLGTYACLIVSAIDGTVDVATNTTEKLLGAINGTVAEFANELDDGLDDISVVINKVLAAASKVEQFFKGGDDDDSDPDSHIKKVNMTISALRHVYIPSSINDKLRELSARTPDFDTVKNDTKKLIAEPFQLVRNQIKAINTTGIVENNVTMFYVPPLNDGSNSGPGICSSNIPEINKLFNGLCKSLKVVTVIFVVIFAVGALVMLIPESWNEYRRWGRLMDLQAICLDRQDAWYVKDPDDTNTLTTVTPQDENLKTLNINGSLEAHERSLDIVEEYQLCFNRWQTLVGQYASNFAMKTGQYSNVQKIQIRWFFAYVFSDRALIILGIGLLGVVLCCIQFIFLAVLKRAMHNIDSKSGSFTNSTVATTLKRDMDIWSTNTNMYINATEANINQQIFGWIETTTTSVNQTVNHMIQDIDKTLVKIFNGTLLYNPMKTVVKCVIEDKLYAVEKAMTWVHDKAHLSIPRVNGTEIRMAITSANQTTSDGSTKTNVPDTTQIANDLQTLVTTGVQKILKEYHQSVIFELIVSCAILGVWALQIPIAAMLM